MKPRRLEFTDLSQIGEEADRLLRGGYEPAGKWNLAQNCDHLSFIMKGTLDGHEFKVPWLLKFLFGRIALRRILKTRRMRSGIPSPQKPPPSPGIDEAAAVERLKQLVERLRTHQGEMHASPFFGYLTPQEWRELHMIHCAHHLGYLIPKSS